MGARRLWRFLTQNPLAFFGVVVIAVSVAVALLTLVLTLFLTPRYGITGTASATAIPSPTARR